MDKENFNIASSPHWRDGSSLAGCQMLWLLALCPAILASITYFGWSAARIIGLSVVFSVIFDILAEFLLPGKDHTHNLSSIVLGVLLALMLPYGTTWWLILVGSFLVIIIGKKLFGGWGGYPVHPVALAAAMMAISWPLRFDYTASLLPVDFGVLMIEPLRLVKSAGTEFESAFNLLDLLLGRQAAGIGNAMVLWLLIGGLFLIIVRQIPWQIPLSFLTGLIMFSGFLHSIDPAIFASPLLHLFSGGAIFAAFFLATDYTTSPVNPVPMLLYGFLGGALLVLIRSFSNYSDGVVYVILLVNLCNPLLDRITPKVYGLEVESHA